MANVFEGLAEFNKKKGIPLGKNEAKIGLLMPI